ncbi:hypothetical protein IWW39_001071 [Coemansia spiralis]|uniref:Uncharacterized protein n=1 Tax=Coemansia spiralis TaxID=417178 RepID=A0A9W8L4T0_9FUNG|nr:hypothetical protein IWW39_001071 [Coemansia spiralis]
MSDYNWGLDEDDTNVYSEYCIKKQEAYAKIIDLIKGKIGKTDKDSVKGLIAGLEKEITHCFKVRGYQVAIHFVEGFEEVNKDDVNYDGNYFKYTYKVVGESDGIKYTSKVAAGDFERVDITDDMINQ